MQALNNQSFSSLLKKKGVKIIDFKDLMISETLLGRGGFGHVYQGKYLNSDVAIKKYMNCQIKVDDSVKPENLEVINEIANGFLLNFPRVNKCYGVSFDSNGFIYSINNLAKCDLKKRLKENLTNEDKYKFASQLIEILLQLDSLNIVHRDLKPQKLLLTNSDDLEICDICDFGTVRKIDGEQTITNNAAFTVEYAPPEFIKGENIAGTYSDIWSLGVILYELYYRERLWGNKTRDEIFYSIDNEIIPTIQLKEFVPETITKIISKCLEIKPQNRWTIKEINKCFNQMEKN